MRGQSAWLIALGTIVGLGGAGALSMTRGEVTQRCTIAADATVICDDADDTSLSPLAVSPLQSLIDAAAVGDTILVGPATYTGSLTFRGKNVTLRSTDGPDVTILAGGGPVVDIGPGGALIGFTVKNGYAYDGAAVLAHGVGSLIKGNTIRDNVAPMGGTGTGVGGNGASPVIDGNTFTNNSCDSQSSAGVVSLHNGSSPTIVNNVFVDNSCRAVNVGVPEGFVPVVINNTIVGNPVGIRVDRRVNTALHVYENNLITNNGIGLSVEFGSASNNPTWKNNLVYGNSVNYDVISDQTGLNGNISADPKFVDYAGDDFRIDVTSPAVDAGDNVAPRLPTTDFNGDDRIIDGNGDSIAVVDIGADEYTWWNRPPVAVAGSDQTILCHDGTPVVSLLDGSASSDPDSTPGTNDDIILFAWFEDFGTPSQTQLGSGGQLQALFTGGVHRVTLLVTDRSGATARAAIIVDVRGGTSCDDGNPCTTDAVTPSCGCDHTPTPGASCDDGNACTTVGTCDANGACLGVAPIVCDDHNDCTVDKCARATGCVYLPNTLSCDDFNACTTNDTCVGGYCSGTPLDDGKACDDQNPCTTDDACRWGWCFGGSALPDGTTCDDRNLCTTGERCRQGTCTGSVPFVQAGGSPIAATSPIVIGDFNEDGNPDIVAGSQTDVSTLLVFLGDGAGGLAQASTVQLTNNSYTSFVVVADFNRDGRPDVAASQSSGGNTSVGVFLGNGAGGFVPVSSSPPSLGSSVKGFLTADFDNDGNPDLASASPSGAVTILLGNGTGGFVPHGSFAGGQYPGALATGDFNGDGNPDLAVGSATTTGGVVIALGDGAGGFTAGTMIPTGDGPSSIAVGDLDQDGDLDLALGNGGFGSTTLSILDGNGHGQFSSPYTVSAGGDSYSVVAADVDLDGHLDLIVGFFDYHSVGVLLGSGYGYFHHALGSPVSLSGDRTQLVVADFDRDGRPDIAAATWSTTEVKILLNRSVGMACPPSDGCSTNLCDRHSGACHAVPLPAGSSCDDHDSCTANDSCVQGSCTGALVTCVALDVCHRAGVCDPAGGCPDLSAPDGTACNDANACTRVDACEAGACIGGDPVTCTSDDQCKIPICNPASGACGLAARPEATPCDDGGGCTTGDACHSGSCVSGLSFVNPPGSPVPAGTSPSGVVVADLNGDGHQDFVVGNPSSRRLILLSGDGLGGFASMSGSPIVLPLASRGIRAGDFNADGRTDLVYTSADSSSHGYVNVLLGVPGGFVTAPGSPLAVGKTPGAFDVGDFNHDGWPDLAIELNTTPRATAAWYVGDGTGRLSDSGWRFVGDGTSMSTTVADLDLDGNPDLVLANGSWPSSVTIQFAFASSPSRRDLTPAGGCWGAIVGDVNLDGRPDIVCPGRQNINVFLGAGYRTFSQHAVTAWDTGPGYVSMELVDFNLDGQPDLAINKSSPNGLTILLGDGTGNFAEAACSPIGATGSMAAGDFNSDGKPDLAVVRSSLNAIAVYLDAPSLATDGTTCSDGDGCTEGDACFDGACRRGTAVATPVEVQDVAASDKVTFAWSAPQHATRYDVVRGSTGGFPVGSGGMDELCFDELPGAMLVDATIPEPGGGFWYLSRAENACGNGTFGIRSDGSPRITTTCP